MSAYPIYAILMYLSILFAPPGADRITIDLPGSEPAIELVRDGQKWSHKGNAVSIEKDSLVVFGEGGKESFKITDFVALPDDHDWSKNPRFTLGGGNVLEKVATGFTLRRTAREGNGVYQIRYHKPVTVNVLGGVVNQGAHAIRADGTAQDAIAAAGGPTAGADMQRVSLIRGPSGAVPEVTAVDLSKREASSPRIQSGDTIYVPKSTGPGIAPPQTIDMTSLEKAILEQQAKLEGYQRRLEEIAGNEVQFSPTREHLDAIRDAETQEALVGAMKKKWEELAGTPFGQSQGADEIPSGSLPASNRLQIRVVAPDDPQAVEAVQTREDGNRETLKLKDNVVVCDRHVEDAGIQESGDGYGITVTLNEAGAKRLAAATKDADGKMRLAVMIDGQVKSAPVVMQQLGRHFLISGFRNQEECQGLLRDLVEWPGDGDLAAMAGWLEQIDQGDTGEAWSMGSEYLRQNLPRAKFGEMIAAARQPLGEVVSRRLVSAKRIESPPGTPEGLYLASEFDSRFSGMKEAKEMVTLQREKDGHWRICGYFIR